MLYNIYIIVLLFFVRAVMLHDFLGEAAVWPYKGLM